MKTDKTRKQLNELERQLKIIIKTFRKWHDLLHAVRCFQAGYDHSPYVIERVVKREGIETVANFINENFRVLSLDDPEFSFAIDVLRAFTDSLVDSKGEPISLPLFLDATDNYAVLCERLCEIENAVREAFIFAESVMQTARLHEVRQDEK